MKVIIMQDKLKQLNRFMSLFTGLNRAYGVFLKDDRIKTILKPVSIELYQNHLDGKQGLGIVPINDENVCMFGAIDIDDLHIDTNEIFKKIISFEAPLILCKSKSKGVHCYMFSQGIKAKKLRSVLSRWAARLGYGNSEIFPKQDILTHDQVGNWINLPYFNGFNDPQRAMIGLNNTLLDFDTFLTAAERIRDYKEEKQQESMIIDNELDKDMPPCLSHYATNGIIVGERNEILYNFGVYFKKSDPNGWEERLYKFNYGATKPLSNMEMQKLVKSLNRKEYHYKCHSSPIEAYCDKILCQTLKHGVISSSNYGEILIGGLTKIMTDPPKWVLEMNGIELEATTEELMSYPRMRMLCMEKIDFIAPPMNIEAWLRILQEKMASKRIISAPEDASQYGAIKQSFIEFLQMADRARGREDIMRGLPVRTFKEKDQIIMFRSHDLLNFLKRKKVTLNLTSNNLWSLLRNCGCDHYKAKISNTTIQVWYIKDLEDMSIGKLEPLEEGVDI